MEFIDSTGTAVPIRNLGDEDVLAKMPPNFRCIIFLRLVDLNMSEFNSASTHYDRSRTSIGPE